MNPNWTGLIATCASVVLFASLYGPIKRLGRARRLMLLAASSICGIPAVLFATYYLHVLPEWAWFYELRSWRGSEWLILPLACAAACLAGFLPRILLPFVVSGLIAIAVVPYLKPLVSPVRDADFTDLWEGGACLQSTGSSCGPASVATIMAQLGIKESEREIAHAAFTSGSGTEAWYLARHVRSKGLRAEFDFRPGLPDDLRLPAMIGVKLGAMGHFIAVLARDGDQLTVTDPLTGIKTMTLQDLKKHCELTGFHLSITRDR